MSEGASVSKKPVYKKWWFWLLVIIVLMVIGSARGKPSDTSRAGSNDQPAQTAPQEQAMPVTAIKLFADYQANEIAADNAYKTKLVEVSGTIDNIGKDILDKPYISLKTGEPLGTVQCMLDESAVTEAGALVEGAKVTMHGRVDGKLGNVIVRKCTLVK